MWYPINRYMKSVTETAQQLSRHFRNIEEILRNVFECIRTEKSSYIDAAQRLNASLKDEVKQLQNDLDRTRAEASLVSPPLLTGLKHLNHILVGNEKLINAGRKKSEHHILFSPKAMQEIEYLIGSTKYLFRYLGDVIINRNPAILKHIISATDSLDGSAERFALEHEERSIIGLCQPLAALVFLDILNSLKETARYINEIAQGISHE